MNTNRDEKEREKGEYTAVNRLHYFKWISNNDIK